MTRAQLLAKYIQQANVLYADLEDSTDFYNNLPAHHRGGQYERNILNAIEITQRELLRLERTIAGLRSG